jgi:hypothetical protein
MSGKSVPLKFPAAAPTLEYAGECDVQGTGADLEQIMRVLADASAILPRFGDNASDVRAWKLCCGLNFAAFNAETLELARRIRVYLEPTDNSPEWQKSAEVLTGKASEVLGEAVPADAVLQLMCDDGDARANLEGAYGKAAVDKLLKSLGGRRLLSLEEEKRVAALRQAAEILCETLVVRVRMVRWDKIPNGLSGGYLRELAWMFAEVPEKVRGLVAAAAVKNVVPVPIDSEAKSGTVESSKG